MSVRLGGRSTYVPLYKSSNFGTTKLWDHLDKVHNLPQVAAIALAPRIVEKGQTTIDFSFGSAKMQQTRHLAIRGEPLVNSETLLRATAQYFIDTVLPYNSLDSPYYQAMMEAANPATVKYRPNRRGLVAEVLKIHQETKAKLKQELKGKDVVL